MCLALPGWQGAGAHPACQTAPTRHETKRRWRRTWWRGSSPTHVSIPAATACNQPHLTGWSGAACRPWEERTDQQWLQITLHCSPKCQRFCWTLHFHKKKTAFEPEFRNWKWPKKVELNLTVTCCYIYVSQYHCEISDSFISQCILINKLPQYSSFHRAWFLSVLYPFHGILVIGKVVEA